MAKRPVGADAPIGPQVPAMLPDQHGGAPGLTRRCERETRGRMVALKPIVNNSLILTGAAVSIGLMLIYARWFAGEDLQQPPSLLLMVFLGQILIHWVALRRDDPDGRIAWALMISNALLFVALLLRWDQDDWPEWSLFTGLIPRAPWHRSLGPPAWWPLASAIRSGALWPNVVLFVPLFTTWAGIARMILREQG